MSEEPKKMNKHLTKYEEIYQRLAKVTTIYLKYRKAEQFEDFITSERGINKTGLNNMLIEIPKENIIDIIKKQYISEPNNEGEIGTIEPEKQADEIRNIALLMLMSNRLSKEYKRRTQMSKEQDETEKAKCLKNEKDLLVWKNNAQIDLLASLYVLRKTEGQEYSDYFCYGDYRDKKGESTSFVIDLPYMGQISVHYGMEKGNIIEQTREKIISILERKRALGQIDKSQFKKLKEEININQILPTYEGKLYEYTSALPLEYIGTSAKEKIEQLGLETKSLQEINIKDIKKMQDSGLNEREAYYLLIKLGCSKEQLQNVIKVYSQRKIPNEVKIGKASIRMTTAQERAVVLQYEQRNLQRYRQQTNNRAIGG